MQLWSASSHCWRRRCSRTAARSPHSTFRSRAPSALLTAFAAACLIAAAPALATAQDAVGGIVLSESTLQPVPAAQVAIQGTTRATTTDQNGRFLFDQVQAAEVTLTVRRIGYRPATQVARPGQTNLRILLADRAVDLDEVVVTGTAGAQARREIGNAVTQVNVAQVTEVTQINSFQELLNARVPGLVIQPGSGSVGTGSRIRVRGVASLSLRNEPLIYVDGVRIDNQNTTGPSNQGFGSSSISRFNDINPDDIESIEVIKGPAAATLYGTEAANGVIQIITKRGAAGPPRWNATVRQGVNFLANPEGLFPTNYQVVDGDTVTIRIVDLENARGTPIFRTGRVQQYDLSLTGGGERARYFVSGGYEQSEGAERSNDLDRYNTRVNVSLNPTDRMDLDVRMGYTTGVTHVSAEGGFGGRVWSTVLADARNLSNPQRRGFHTGTPEAYDLLNNFEQGINRFVGSLQARHNTTSWLSQRLTFGVDLTREDNSYFEPRVDSMAPGTPHQAVWGSTALGSRQVTNRSLNHRTVDYSATGRFSLTPGISSATTLGGQYYRSLREFVFASGQVFPAPGLSAVSATTTNRVNAQDLEEEVSIGLFVQQQFGFGGRLYVTGAVRSDDHSAFGQNFDRVYYPKASVSWVLSEEEFWPFAFAESFRLRAAFGQSGKAPANYAALRTYSPVSGPGDSPAVTPQFIGNPDLGPERSSEIEVGFDASFLEDRLGLEFTYYDKRTRDAILEREIAPSIGFSGFQPFNIGRLSNKGTEAVIRGRPLQRAQTSLDLSLSLATNSNRLVDLGLDGVEWVSAGGFLRHQVGLPVGALFDRRIVSAELNAAGQAINVMCDDGQGGAVACASAPEVYQGRTIPKVEGAFASTLTLFGQVRVYALFDFKRGHRKIDGDTRVRCAFFGGRCRENFYPHEFDPIRIAGIQSSPAISDWLMDDASFTKFRELSVSYTLPERISGWVGADAASVSLAGRNLHTWTNYGGLEPEAMFLGGTRGGNHGAWQQTMMPQLRQWVTTLNVRF